MTVSERLNELVLKARNAATVEDHSIDDEIYKRHWLASCRILDVPEQETLFVEAGMERLRRSKRRSLKSIESAYAGQLELLGLDEMTPTRIYKDGKTKNLTKQTEWLNADDFDEAIKIQEESIAHDRKRLEDRRAVRAMCAPIWEKDRSQPLWQVLLALGQKGSAA